MAGRNGESLRYVVCFYWQGERWVDKGRPISEITEDVNFHNHLLRIGRVSNDLAAHYVNNLYRGVKKWAARPFRFVCFTNEPLNVLPQVELRQLPMITRRGVMPRMYMFSREAGLWDHQVLSLDIDVIIVGTLEQIMAYEGLFCVRESWSKSEFGLPDGDVMSFRAGPETEALFWKPLIADVATAERISTGRERLWIRHCTRNQCDLFKDVVPGAVVSYKHHVRRRPYLRNHLVRIVSCHGKPRPHQFRAPWKDENWPMPEHIKKEELATI